MVRGVVFVLGLLPWVVLAAGFKLIDIPQQGALIRGQADAGVTVMYQGEALAQTDKGFFVFGVGRDAKTPISLEWHNGNQRGTEQYDLVLREYNVQHIDGLPTKMVSPSEAVLKRLRHDNQQVAKARAITSDVDFFSQQFIWPAEGPISGVYGSQRVLNGKPKRPHYGVDVAGPVGTPIVAPADGVVTLYVPDMVYSGGTMILDHGHGVNSTFLHLSDAHVKVGDSVKQGQLIADMGATGRATGSHLDWRMNWRNVRVDPELLVPARPRD